MSKKIFAKTVEHSDLLGVYFSGVLGRTITDALVIISNVIHDFAVPTNSNEPVLLGDCLRARACLVACSELWRPQP